MCDITNSPPKDIKKSLLLGRGAYGDVYLDEESGKATKIMKYDDTYDPCLGFNPTLIRELSTISLMQKCEFVPKILNIYFGDSYGFTMEKFYGSLHDVLTGKLLSKEKLLLNLDKIVFKLVYVLAYASSKMIIHRDVKPQNILINDDYNIALTDWGLSVTNISYNRHDDRTVQTLWYRCPEHLLRLSDDQNNDTIDMWSVGIIMLEIMRGKHGIVAHNTEKGTMEIILKILGYPKDSSIIQGLKDNEILSTHYADHSPYIEELKKIDGIDMECIDFIEKCLEYSPHKRLSPISALQHLYINKNSSIIDTSKLIMMDNISEKLLELDEYCIDIHNIKKNNPKYLLMRHKYLNSYKLIKDRYGMTQHELALMITYTDKLFEVISIVDEYSFGSICAVSCIVFSITAEILPKISHLKKILKIENVSDNEIKEYVINVIKILKFPFPIKTFITYQILLEPIHGYIATAYKFLCNHIVESDKYIGIKAEHIFSGILNELKNYYYYDRSTKHVTYFSPLLENLVKRYPCRMIVEFTSEHNYIPFKNGFISTELKFIL